MNLNHEETDSDFNQRCLELAKLLRTEQTDAFLRLYDSLPSEWNGSRLDSAKEYIRQLQELDEPEFEFLYQRVFHNNKNKQENSNNSMSKLPIQSSIIQNNDESANNLLTSLTYVQQDQYIEKQAVNNLTNDDKYDASLKNFSSIKRNTDETNTKTRRLQSITNNNNNNNTNLMMQNNCHTRTPVDSFVQLNLKPSIDITVEDYKKTRSPMSTTKTINTNSRTCLSQTNDIHSSNTNITNLKKPKASIKNKSHEEASFDYFSKCIDDDQEPSRSSSSSPSSSTTINRSSKLNTTKNDLSINQTKTFEHSKLIPNNDFDSHGSSIATKSSSENSGSARTGSASDSDDDHRKVPFLPTKKLSQSSKTKSLNNDDTPTIVLSTTSDYRTSQHDRISSLPPQNSYELVQLNSTDNPNLLASQLPRFKISATDDSNGINNSTNDIVSYPTQRSQPKNFTSSSHQNRNPDHQEHYNSNHSNTSRKSSSRPNRKRKQSQQEIIRTELIPGHRGDRDVDELVMFIDGNSTTKEKQRHNSAPLRPTDTNSNNNPNSATTSRRKSRKPIKITQESINNNENKTLQIDEDTQSIDYIDDDDDDERTTSTATTTHSVNNTYTTNTSLPNDDDDDESHSNTIDIDSTNDSNTTNGETSLPSDWLEPRPSTSPINDDNENESLSSPTNFNNSNSENISEPFVTVTHRRRVIKERRQDNNSLLSTRSSRLPLSSNTNDKRRFQSSTQNGVVRPTIRNSLSNIKPFISTTGNKEESKTTNSSSSSPPLPSSPTVSQPSAQSPSQTQSQVPSISNPVTEQSSPRLSSHSSSSSLPSLVKRQSKPPPVVFLNKSKDVDLTDVSFGFDFENPLSSSDKAKTPTPPPAPQSPFTPPQIPTDSDEKEPQIESNTLTSSTQVNDSSVNSKPSSRRSYQQQHQRNSRGLLFYSGSDIRPQQHHRNYSSQTTIPQSSYIDPLLYLQYNQQRLAANYSQQLTYMNLLRAQYLPSQSPYVYIPTTYTTINDHNQDEKVLDDESNQTSEHVQEPLLVYATLPTQNGPIYIQPTKKSYYDLEQIQGSTIYPSQYYYSPQTQHIIPSSTAYFQPISSPSLLIDSKSQHDETDEEEDNDYEKSAGLFNQRQSSSHIMSNALQLVYSQEKRNVQTDSFNLEQLTSYLAMKWADNINHYEQGDDEILLMG